MTDENKAGRTPPTLATLVLLSGSAAMVMNVFMASLPQMARDFGVDYSQVQLAITAYLMGTALAQLFIGPMSDRYGRRPIILVCYAIYVLASIGAAMAQGFTFFMMCRMLQCAVVAGLVISRAAVRDMVSGSQAASMIAYVTMGMSLVPMLAPSLGGVIDEFIGWRSVFAFMAITGLIALVASYFDFGETKLVRAKSMTAQFALYPDLLRSRRFWGYTILLTFTSGMFFSYLSGGPYLGDKIYGLSGGELGLYLGAAPFGYFFGNWFSGKFAARIGIAKLIYLGLSLSLIGMACAIIPVLMGATHPLAFFGFTVFIGLGNGMTMPSGNAGMLEARPDLAGSASGLSGSIMMLGGAGLAQLGGVMLTKIPNPLTLIFLILISGALAMAAAIWTQRVERQLNTSQSGAK